MSLIELPLFLVQDGKLVRRTGLRTFEAIDRGIEDTLNVMKRAVPQDEVVYVWDVDGIQAGAANHEFYQKLERKRIPPWIDAGCRNAEDAMDAFFAGAEVLTIHPERMGKENLSDFAEIAEGEFHLGVSFSTRQPDAPTTSVDLRRLVGELNAQGVVVEATPATDPNALHDFVKRVQSEGLEVTLLTTYNVRWLADVARKCAAARLVAPWTGAS